MKIIYMLSLIILFQIVVAEEEIGINFFDLSQAYLNAHTSWDGEKSEVYVCSPATLETQGTGKVPVDMGIGSGSLVLQTTLPGGWWNVLLKFDSGHSVNFLRHGQNPLLYLRLKWAAVAPGANVRIELLDNSSIWNLYSIYDGKAGIYTDQTASVLLSRYVEPSTETWQDVYIPMSDFLAANAKLDITRIARIAFYGYGRYNATNILYIEKIKIVPAIQRKYVDMVKVNQFGYLPNQRKLAIISYESGTVPSAPTSFQVKNLLTGELVYQGDLQPAPACPPEWDQSGDTVYYADFSSLTMPGRYIVALPDLGQVSPPFDVDANVFHRPFRDGLRFFYYARSGQAIAEPFAEGHTRPAIYASNAESHYDYDDNDSTHAYDYDPLDQGITTRDICGGWFDAGDIHIDTHNNVATLWFLLEILEQHKDKVGPNMLNLPESNGLTNDLILLIQWELEWFKKMQNQDGSVHFMVISPEGDESRQQVSDISSGATCILAAIFAKAYALFSTEQGMQSYAADLLKRAELSWSWLSQHPTTYDPMNPLGRPYTYHIPDDRPYRALAAIELYIATGTDTYRTYFENEFKAQGGNALTAWGNNQAWHGILGLLGFGPCKINLGYMDYVETIRPVDAGIKAHLIQKFTDQANFLLEKDESTPYKLPMVAPNHLFWGSSGMFCSNAYVLLRLYAWTDDPKYRDAAIDALDWISGRNPVARNFITGYSDYVHGTDLYSFYWFDHRNPVPGYLCGNINCMNYGKGILMDYHIQYPWKYYLNLQNASFLEPCLPWQAAMCYLFGYFVSK